MAATHFSMRVEPSPTLKVIISVSKKVAKLAVVRNRTRRRIRPIIKELLDGKKPAQYMVVAKPGAQNLKGGVLRDELAELVKKL